METTSKLVRDERRPDWPAAAVAGFAAGAVLMVLDLLWSVLVVGASPWANAHRIAGIVMGPPAADATAFDAVVVAVSLAAHYALGIAFGLLLAAVVTPFGLDAAPGTAATVGAVFGVALYFVNFHAIVQLFPWLAAIRGWATLIGHVVFGVCAALLYWKLSRRPAAPGALTR
ncbi:MAG: hypothetical protein BroJett026_19570 [Betaproteobacteria bacterium]|nr:MAG: hypothetical protein BroJett026_19570 [Betaproteobacteria bacterium]